MLIEETPAQPVSGISNLEMTNFQREQIRTERLKAWLTAASILVSTAAVILTYVSAQSIQAEQARVAFQLKAAEIVMASRSPWEAKGKANALATFFEKQVPLSMADGTFKPEEQGWGRASHQELLALLMTASPSSPEQRALILETYKAFFPGDTWLNKISVP